MGWPMSELRRHQLRWQSTYCGQFVLCHRYRSSHHWPATSPTRTTHTVTVTAGRRRWMPTGCAGWL